MLSSAHLSSALDLASSTPSQNSDAISTSSAASSDTSTETRSRSPSSLSNSLRALPPRPTPPTRPAHLSPSEQLLTSLLDVPLRITMSDGRAFVGGMICVDRSMNVILSQAEEFLPDGWGKDGQRSNSITSTKVPTAPPSIATTGTPLSNPSSQFDPTSSLPITTGAYGGREMSMVLCPGPQIRKIEAQISWGRWRGIMEVEEVYT